MTGRGFIHGLLCINGMRIAVKRGSSLYYLHGDHLSSTSLTTNTGGGQTAGRAYYAYGSTRSSSGTLQTDRTFTGQKQDGTGLLYYNARYYDPALGTFLSPDTIVPDPGAVIDYNRFLYARGNPLKYTDPSGHVYIEEAGAGLGPGSGTLAYVAALALSASYATSRAVTPNDTATRPVRVPPLREILPRSQPQKPVVSGVPLAEQPPQ